MIDHSPIKVLHVIDHLGLGGAQTVVFDLVKALDKRGTYQSLVCCLREPTLLSDEIQAAGIPLVHLNTNRHNPLQIALVPLKLVALIRKEDIVLMHTHLFASNGSGRIAGRLVGLPVIIHEHANESSVVPLYERLTDQVLASSAAAVIAVSQTTREYNIRVKGISPGRVHVIPNGLNLDRFRPEAIDRGKVRGSLNVPPDAPLVIGVGRLERQKRFDVWLEAAAQVHRQIPNARFLIVGDGSLRQRLETQARELGLDTVVCFTGPRQDVPDLLVASDLFVLSSDWEGLPITLLEALAMRVPAVATAVDGSVEVLQGSEAGRLVPPGDVESLAKAIVELLQDKNRAQTLGLAGRKVVEVNYSIGTVAQQVEAIYDEVLRK